MIDPNESGEERMVELAAYAKINLALDVLGRRADGYHELRTVMQIISLHDDLRLSLGTWPDGGSNAQDVSLIDKALQAVRVWSGSEEAMGYHVVKRIPTAAGLGGGSSDAAAAIRGACLLLGLHPSEEELLELAASVGSDVPFFLLGGTALVEGRGERVTGLPDAPAFWVLLASSGRPVSTGAVFGAWSEADAGDGQASNRVLAALEQSRVVLDGNDLLPPSLRVEPGIEEDLARLRSIAPDAPVGMTGSGGTVMALFDDPVAARQACEQAQRAFSWVSLAQSVSRPDR